MKTHKILTTWIEDYYKSCKNGDPDRELSEICEIEESCGWTLQDIKQTIDNDVMYFTLIFYRE